MDPMIGGSLILAGSSLAGGIMNKLFDDSSEINQQNYNNQKEFAQNSIQWRVNDAKKAGIHPLAALGTQGSYYTPSASASSANYGDMVASVGGQIGSALMQKSLMLQNQKLMADINKTNAETKAIQGQNSAQLPLATIETTKLPKDTREVGRDIARGKMGILDSQSTQNQFSLLPTTTQGRYKFSPSQNSVMAEKISEGGVTGFIDIADLNAEAGRYVKDLNKKVGYNRYAVDYSLSQPTIIDTEKYQPDWTEKYSPTNIFGRFFFE
nr:hypothetical protein [Limosilactobacillus mucosae]